MGLNEAGKATVGQVGKQVNELPVICLMGPTAIGKSALAVDLAEKFNCEIISVDSALVYRQMNIGTAKPTEEEQRGIPHHLLDIIDPAESYSTGLFCEQATALIDEIAERGRIPLLVGGTMQYFYALLNGLAQLPSANPAVRQQLEADAALIGWQGMHERLAQIDSTSAERIHPNDPQRIQRALEVYAITGQSLSTLIEAQNDNKRLNAISLALLPEQRQILHERIRLRFDAMLSMGLIEETQQLFQRGDLNDSMPAIRSVGYRQVWAYLQGETDYDLMQEKGVIATRQLAKRQMTWLRQKFDCQTFLISENMPTTEICHFVVTQLNEKL